MTAPCLEALESRRLLSVAMPTAGGLALVWPVLRSPVTATSTILAGTTINAEANQAFRAVIGTIRGLGPLPTGYSLRGDINWGDGSAMSQAQFVRQGDGSIAVLGAHTYAKPGADDIKVVVSAVPPPGSEAPVLFVGTFQSKANVIAPAGGVTLEETAGVPFTATVGFFSSKFSSSRMAALIQWGDGTQSRGRILALPTAGLVPRFAVVGSHAYAKTGSYVAHVAVYMLLPSTIVGPTGPTSSPSVVVVVAQIDSVIEVLPPLPTTVTA